MNIFHNFIAIFYSKNSSNNSNQLDTKIDFNKIIKNLDENHDIPSADDFNIRVKRKIGELTLYDLLYNFNINMLENNSLFNKDLLDDDYMIKCDNAIHNRILELRKKEISDTNSKLAKAIIIDKKLYIKLNLAIQYIKQTDYTIINDYLTDPTNNNYRIKDDKVISDIYTKLKNIIFNYYKKKQELYNDVILKIFKISINDQENNYIQDFHDDFTYETLMLHTYKAREIILELYIYFFENIKKEIFDKLKSSIEVNRDIIQGGRKIKTKKNILKLKLKYSKKNNKKIKKNYRIKSRKRYRKRSKKSKLRI